jgi:[ribosomal protein S18]-alanine N-acetyltransferase
LNAVLQPHAEAPPVLRPMLVRDLAEVLAIETRAYSHPWSQGNFVDSLAAGYVAEVLEATEPAPARGALLGYFVAMPGVDELHLLNVTVAPDCQGQGHGSRLLARVAEHAQRRGHAKLWLEVRQSNQRAQALYRRRGFVEVGVRRNYYPAGVRREDAVVMSLAIDPRAA